MAFDLPALAFHDEDDLYRAMSQIWEISQSKTPIGHYMAEKCYDLNILYMMMRFASQTHFQIVWNHVFEWARYAAVDKDGDVYIFEQEPVLNIDGDCWTTPGERGGEDGNRIEYLGVVKKEWLADDFNYRKALYVRPY